jgi:hypothetical protein
MELDLPWRISGTVIGLAVATTGYTFPVVRYLQRAETQHLDPLHRWKPTLRRMLLAACLSGVALLGTWGSVQQAPPWASNLAKDINKKNKEAYDRIVNRWVEDEAQLAELEAVPRPEVIDPQRMSSWTQFWGSLGAVVGTILAALIASWLGRRVTYFFLCLGSMAIVPTFFLTNQEFDARYWALAFTMGAITASFYGWLPLYLPELFRTSVRATGQGFGFNFGRILAAIGVLQIGNLLALVRPHGLGLGHVCAMLSGIYVVGLIIIWLAPETKGKPLPE